jgi:hypothetical protein
VTGHVLKEVARRFKVYCTAQDLTISEAVETALIEYLEKGVWGNKKPRNRPIPSGISPNSENYRFWK